MIQRLLPRGCGLLSLLLPLCWLSVAPAPGCQGRTTSLYDGTLGGTPATQGMLYQALPIGSLATQTVSGTLTILDSMQRTTDMAGYFGNPARVPALDRTTGYTLTFTVQLLAEDHAGSDKNGDGIDDRAGLSVLVLSSDHIGIELGFWPDQVWAQEGGTGSTLLTHAEGAAFTTTTTLVPYELTILQNTYTLRANGQLVLSGQLRDYSAFQGSINPYQTPNLVFLGDDTSSARARIAFAAMGIQLPGSCVYLPLLM